MFFIGRQYIDPAAGRFNKFRFLFVRQLLLYFRKTGLFHEIRLSSDWGCLQFKENPGSGIKVLMKIVVFHVERQNNNFAGR